jgi:chlorophyllide a reductase subunit Z
MPSDLAEIRRLVEGIGAEVNMVFPLGSHLADVRAWSRPTSTSACTASSAACCARRWSALPAGADRPAQHHRLPAQLGELLGLDPEPFIEREKHTTIKPMWDLWRSVTQDFFGTASFAVVAGETYARGIRHFLEDEMGLPCNFAVSRKPARRPTTTRCASWCTRSRRWCCSAATTSACTWPRPARAGPMKPAYIPASFPGAIIRRHTGTPFMGYAGATYMVQEFCNALFDALFHILPLGTDLDRVDATPARAANPCPGTTMRRRCSTSWSSRAGAGADLGGQAPARPRRARGPPRGEERVTLARGAARTALRQGAA